MLTMNQPASSITIYTSPLQTATQRWPQSARDGNGCFHWWAKTPGASTNGRSRTVEPGMLETSKRANFWPAWVPPYTYKHIYNQQRAGYGQLALLGPAQTPRTRRTRDAKHCWFCPQIDGKTHEALVLVGSVPNAHVDMMDSTGQYVSGITHFSHKSSVHSLHYLLIALVILHIVVDDIFVVCVGNSWNQANTCFSDK